MKKTLILIAVAAALALVPASSMAGIATTAHDLSGKGWGTDQICVFCHTPHNAKAEQIIPLWNHGARTSTSYTLYTSTTLDAGPLGQPVGVSKACLSCHDGVTAIDSYGARTGSNYMTGDNTVGRSNTLADDHPISFTWPTTDTGLYTPSSGKVGTLQLPLYGTGNDQMECGSCHDVHNNAHAPFLRAANAASALCLNCHNK
ncbi:MAG: cytochrome c3 family protein [Thermodesulfobacteriota bacterium]